MKLIIDISKAAYETCKSVENVENEQGNFTDLMLDAIANGTPIPDNATNGDCVRKLFCKGIYRTSVRTNVSVEFKREWWNAPYQKDGKE